METLHNHDQLTDQKSSGTLSRNGAWSRAHYDDNVIQIHQTFKHELTPFLKDSNAYGNIYFARYFEWQGICREMWFINASIQICLKWMVHSLLGQLTITIFKKSCPFRQSTAN